MAEDRDLGNRATSASELRKRMVLPFVAALGVAVSIAVGRFQIDSREMQARARTQAELATIATRLEGSLRSTVNLTEGIAYLIEQDGTISPERFDGLARLAIANSRQIRNIVLAPGEVMRQVYPRPGNESVLGVDYRSLPEQYPAIVRARELGTGILAGPVRLIQGGRGFIFRRPIFVADAIGGDRRYWGLVSVVADVDRFIEAAGLTEVGGLKLALRGKDGRGAEGDLIWGDASVFAQAPEVRRVEVPSGAWQLSAVPSGGWPSSRLLDAGSFVAGLGVTALLLLMFGALLQRNRRISEQHAQLRSEMAEKRIAEAALQQSENRFRKLFGSSPDPCWIIEGKRFVECNDAAVATLRYATRNELMFVHPSRLSPPYQPDGEDSFAKAERMMALAVEKGLHRFEWIHTRADGSEFPAEVTLSRITLDGQEAIFCAWRDITERKATEKALHENQAMMQAIIDNAPALIYVFDPDERLMLCNRLFEQALAHPRAEMVGHRREDFLPADVAAEHMNNDRRVRASGQVQTFEERNIEDGAEHIYLTVKCPLADADGRIVAVIGISTDISERKRNEEQLRMAAVILDNTSDAVVVTDDRTLIVATNRAFTEITGYAAAEVLGRKPSILKSERHPVEFYEEMWQVLRDTGAWKGEVWNRRKNGELYPQWLTVNAIRHPDGRVANYVGMFSDISALKHAQRQLEHLAHFDALTDLPNRILFQDRLQHALDRVARYGYHVAVLLLDLDGFKHVNDSLGHPVGDALLQQTASRLRECVRVEDTVARLGGDEFAIILANLSEGSDVLEVARKITQVLQVPFELDGHSALVTVSIGVAIAPEDGGTPTELIRNADTAMYGAKEGGRNSYRFYQAEMTRRAQQRLSEERALREAIDKGEFELWFQPKIDLASGRTCGAEALLRWRSPERGLVSPLDFVPLAERTGLILPIGEFVLRQSCELARRWRRSGLLDGRVAVNVAAPQIERDDFVALVQKVLAEVGLEPEGLEIEITESLLMESTAQAQTTLRALRALGVTVALDDFGTGYSSLAYLKSLPVHHLKIDRVFVAELPNEPYGMAIVRTIVALGRTLDFRVIAEGVETGTQLDFLRAEGCDEVQGYLFSPPLPVEEFEDWLRARG